MKYGKCPKCGNSLRNSFMSKTQTYDILTDKLNERCIYCGYKWIALSHDNPARKASSENIGNWILAIIGCLLAGYGLYNFLMVIASLLT